MTGDDTRHARIDGRVPRQRRDAIDSYAKNSAASLPVPSGQAAPRALRGLTEIKTAIRAATKLTVQLVEVRESIGADLNSPIVDAWFQVSRAVDKLNEQRRLIEEDKT